MGFGVTGLRFRVWGVCGFRVQGLGFWVGFLMTRPKRFTQGFIFELDKAAKT